MKYAPRKRLPFEQDFNESAAAKASLRRLGLFFLFLGAVLFGGVAYFMQARNGLPWTAPQVLAPAAGSLYFALRLLWSLLAVQGRQHSVD